MAHTHGSAGSQHWRPLAVVLALTSTFTLIEFVGAWLTNSLALLADATHMLTDVGGLGLSLFGIWYAQRPATLKRSYGNARSEILAAVTNGLILLVVGGFILYEAWHRFSEPPEVSSGLMIVVATAGLLVNIVGAVILRRGAGESLNVQGAYLEVLADLLGSVAAIVAGVIMILTGWWYADPLFSLLIGLLIIPRTLRLMAEAVRVLMEGAPSGLDPEAVAALMRRQPEVEDLHDLHIWSVSSGLPILTAHVRTGSQVDGDALLKQLNRQLEQAFDIHHTTIQLERSTMVEESFHADATVTTATPKQVTSR